MKSNQNSVMNGKFVKNIVMNEELMKNRMNAEIDPKVVMGLSTFKIG